MKKITGPLPILLAEDDENDIIIIKYVFKKMGLAFKLTVVRDGKEALDYITHAGKYAVEKPPRPGLVMLDISMPVMNGFEVLKQIKSDDKYKSIPVIMMTKYDNEEFIAKSYEIGACSYLSKPPGAAELTQMLEKFGIYWTKVSMAPADTSKPRK